MLKVLLVIALLVGVRTAGIRTNRYKEIKDRATLKRILDHTQPGVQATCEVVFFATPKNYSEAANTCKSFKIGGSTSLVTVDSVLKNSHVMFAFDYAFSADEAAKEDSANQWIWTGLTKTKNNNVIYSKSYMKKKKNVLEEYNAEDWRWTSNKQSPINFDKWPKGRKDARPNQQYLDFKKKGCKEEGGCFQNQLKISSGSNNGFWDDAWGFEEYPFACDYRGKYLVSGEIMTWSKAKNMCERAGMVLASVRSSADVRMLLDAIEYFQGPRNESWGMWEPMDWVWLGATDVEEERVWRYLDGSLMDWDIPWKIKAGNDNAMWMKKSDGQHWLAMNRDGVFDDSYDAKKIKKMFACECPGSLD